MGIFLGNLNAALPAISAALIAAAVAFIGLVIAKENKVSEFRQAWIDALRQDIAEYISAVRNLAQAHMNFAELKTTAQDELEFNASARPVHLSSSSALARIRLRINPDDPNEKLRVLNSALLSKATEIQECLGNQQYLASLYLSNALHQQAAPILKLEWQRVKQGEPVYRVAKYVALAIFILLLALLVYGFMFTRHLPSS